eukprot:TRINITY_DN4077_c0_g1_i5.p1 TRINITY_DN4077_c0_g1~~TRINITY_DN4077_c0_g1_i5.p1  ORF type:complete len:953 (-),score=302.03 TRINITY_DN4077_c0_g1_i5:2332-5133(-)
MATPAVESKTKLLQALREDVTSIKLGLQEDKKMRDQVVAWIRKNHGVVSSVEKLGDELAETGAKVIEMDGSVKQLTQGLADSNEARLKLATWVKDNLGANLEMLGLFVDNKLKQQRDPWFNEVRAMIQEESQNIQVEQRRSRLEEKRTMMEEFKQMRADEMKVFASQLRLQFDDELRTTESRIQTQLQAELQHIVTKRNTDFKFIEEKLIKFQEFLAKARADERAYLLDEVSARLADLQKDFAEKLAEQNTLSLNVVSQMQAETKKLVSAGSSRVACDIQKSLDDELTRVQSDFMQKIKDMREEALRVSQSTFSLEENMDNLGESLHLAREEDHTWIARELAQVRAMVSNAGALLAGGSVAADGVAPAVSVAAWLAQIGQARYADAFVAHGYTDTVGVAHLKEGALDAMGITLPGHRKAILAAVKELQSSGGAQPQAALAPAASAASLQREQEKQYRLEQQNKARLKLEQQQRDDELLFEQEKLERQKKQAQIKLEEGKMQEDLERQEQMRQEELRTMEKDRELARKKREFERTSAPAARAPKSEETMEPAFSWDVTARATSPGDNLLLPDKTNKQQATTAISQGGSAAVEFADVFGANARTEKERAERAEKERAERERAERERAERELAEKERVEKERAEKNERAERERAERERAERELAEKERVEKEKAEKERAEKNERAERERAERERAERELAEKERVEKEKAEKERAEKNERAERERAEKERAEKERAERERAEKEKAEKDHAERERAEKEQERKALQEQEREAEKEREREELERELEERAAEKEREAKQHEARRKEQERQRDQEKRERERREQEQERQRERERREQDQKRQEEEQRQREQEQERQREQEEHRKPVQYDTYPQKTNNNNNNNNTQNQNIPTVHSRADRSTRLLQNGVRNQYSLENCFLSSTNSRSFSREDGSRAGIRR